MKKKISAILLAIIIFTLSACSGNVDGQTDTTGEQQSLPESTQESAPTLSQMSPPSADVTLPIETEHDFSRLDLTGATSISAEDAVLSSFSAEKICRLDDREYYYMEDGKVFVIFLNADSDIEYSAYYNETGRLFYFGDNNCSWYFNEGNSLDCYVYTYIIAANGNEVITFYDAQGKREYILTGGVYYDNDFLELSDEQTLEVIKRYGETAEVNS